MGLPSATIEGGVLSQESPGSYLWVICILLSVVFIAIKFIRRRRRNKSNLPPSPPKLPFIGNLHQLGTLPHRSFQALSHKYGPLMLLQLGQVPTLVISSATVAREVFKAHDAVFSNQPKATAAQIFLYDYKDVGKQKRRICALELVSMKNVRSFQFIRVEEVAEMMDAIRKACASTSSLVNLSDLLIALTNNIMSRCVIEEHRTKMKKRKGDESYKKDFVDILLQLEEAGTLGFDLSQDILKALLVVEKWSHIAIKEHKVQMVPFSTKPCGSYCNQACLGKATHVDRFLCYSFLTVVNTSCRFSYSRAFRGLVIQAHIKLDPSKGPNVDPT
ncbi:hypothetical protein VNO77_24748 [Canavalia gladiata]|uniref:Uncharacterized protein n=1 Tax=Canavalia gladiata TaxID=3824 RepID=A0AAN9LA79_CANGL